MPHDVRRSFSQLRGRDDEYFTNLNIPFESWYKPEGIWYKILYFHCILRLSNIFVSKSSTKGSANYGSKINRCAFLIFSCIWCQVILIHDLMKLETLFPSILGSIKHMPCPQKDYIFSLRNKIYAL